MVNGGHHRDAEPLHQKHPVAETLVVVDDVERLLGHQRTEAVVSADAEGERFGEGAEADGEELEEAERRIDACHCLP